MGFIELDRQFDKKMNKVDYLGYIESNKKQQESEYKMNRIEYIQHKLQQIEEIYERQCLMNLVCEVCGSKKNKNVLRLVNDKNVRYEVRNALILCNECLCKRDEVLAKRSKDIKNMNKLVKNDLNNLLYSDNYDTVDILNQILKKVLVFDYKN